MKNIEKILLKWVKPHMSRSKMLANICFILMCRQLGYGYKRILKVLF